MKTLVCGYYGYANAGDELILESIVNAYKAQSRASDITILSNTPKVTTKYYDIKSVNRWNIFLVLKEVLRADALLLGGGGLFQDKTSSLSLYYYLSIAFTAKAFGKKLSILGVSINELTGLNRWFLVKTIESANVVTVREKASLKLLKDWGCKQANISVVPDFVFSSQYAVKKDVNAKPVIAFVLRPLLNKTSSLSQCVALVKSFAKQIDAEIVFIPFHKTQDLPFQKKIIAQGAISAIVLQWENTAELRNILKSVDMIVSQRLHALIMAVLYELPFVGISKDPKILEFLNDSGFEGFTENSLFENPDVLAQSLLKVWEQRNETNKKVVQARKAFSESVKFNLGLLP